MIDTLPAGVTNRLTLQADTAADLMTPNPVSIRDTATVREAVALLTNHPSGAAPVLDETGRPVGVLTKTDLLVHEREKTAAADADHTLVRDLMTPAILAVRPDAPVAEVVHQMVQMTVHRLFVVDAAGALVGTVSALDVLRRLQP